MVRMFVLGIVVLVGIALLPTTVWAHVVITEIAYDVEGGDAGFEWIEVHNTGSSSVDLTEWKFREGGVNHGITLIDSSMVGSGSYAIIADDPLKFSSLYSSYNGLIFDSSFSLSNTGEELAIIDPNGIVAYQTVYASEMGAAGDGNTLNFVDGGWVARTPSPGESTAGTSKVAKEAKEDSKSSYIPAGSIILSPTPSDDEKGKRQEMNSDVEPHLFITLTGESKAVVGTLLVFEAQAVSSVSGNGQKDARFEWNFGDGGTASGDNVEHVYRFPGTYTVVTQGKKGSLEGEHSMQVVVYDLDVAIEPLSFGREAGLQIQNSTSLELDLTEWSIDVDGWRYIFPENTRISPEGSATVTFVGTPVYESSRITLFSDMGRRVDEWQGITPRIQKASYTPVSTRISGDFTEVEAPKENATSTIALAASAMEAYGAQVGGVEEQGSNHWLPWVAALSALCLIGITGTFLVRKVQDKDDLAEEYKIIEE